LERKSAPVENKRRGGMELSRSHRNTEQSRTGDTVWQGMRRVRTEHNRTVDTVAGQETSSGRTEQNRRHSIRAGDTL
jgi:hypothetical protein